MSSTATSPSTETAGSSSGFPHFPALDGVRGIAVAAVLVFHGDFAVASGGFLGVSTFFTLSGFLITSLLLTEKQRDGTIALGAFWVRRFKRLLPAAVFTIAGIGVVWHWLDLQSEADFSEIDVMSRLPGDLVTALFYVYNWRAAFPPEGAGYNDLFGEVVEPSPAAHFWSLSIEEQFYVFFPLLAFIVLAKIGSTRLFGGILVVLLGLSLASVTWLDGFDRIYNGTDVRMAEILIGALLAVAFATPTGREMITTNPLLRWLGVLALGVSVALWSVTELTSSWLLDGGLGLYAVGTAAIICAATQARGPVRTVLGWGPLVWLGAVSYGVYLYHWPIFRFVDEDATGLDPVPLFGLRMVFTLALAWLSFHYLEQPVRRGSRPGAGVRWAWSAGAVTVAFVAGLAVVYSDVGRADVPETVFVPTETSTPATTVPTSGSGPSSTVGPGATTTSGPPPATAPFAEPPTILVVGDSIANNLRNGLTRRADALGEPQPTSAVFNGCGLALGGEILWGDGVVRPACREDYRQVHEALGATVDPVVMLVGGPVDLLPRRMTSDEDFASPVDDSFLERLRENFTALQAEMVAEDAAVLWTTVPCIHVDKAAELGIDPGGVDAVNDVIRAVAAEGDGRIGVFDLYDHVCPDGAFVGDLFGDSNAREDGLHFSEAAANQLANDIAAAARTLGPPADDTL